MLKILLESFLLEIAQNNLNADKEINYLYETLNKSHTTDLQKEIKAASMDIQQLKILAYSIINSEEFKEELASLNITIDTPVNNLEVTYNEVITTLENNDKNSTYYEILEENDGNYRDSAEQLHGDLISIAEQYEENTDIYNFYMTQANKIQEVL